MRKGGDGDGGGAGAGGAPGASGHGRSKQSSSRMAGEAGNKPSLSPSVEAGPAAESTPRPSSDADAGESPPEAAGGGRGSGAGTHGRSVEGMSREPEPRPTLPPAEVARLADLLLRGCPGGDLKALREVGRANKAWVDGSLHKRCPSPLHVAAQVGHDAIVNALLEEFHADVNSTDGAGMTPLHTAAEYGNVGVVRLLLHSPNIRPNAQDDFGWTPLHYAACCLKDTSPELIVILVRYGASVQIADMHGYTAADWAYCLGRDHVLSLLRSQDIRFKLTRSCFPSEPVRDSSTDNVHSSASSVSELASSGIHKGKKVWSVMAAGQPPSAAAGAQAEAEAAAEGAEADGGADMDVAMSDGVQDKSSRDGGGEGAAVAGAAAAAGGEAEGQAAAGVATAEAPALEGQSKEGSRPDSKDKGGSSGSNKEVAAGAAAGSNKGSIQGSGMGVGQSNVGSRPGGAEDDEGGRSNGNGSNGNGSNGDGTSRGRSADPTHGSGGTGSGGSNRPFGHAGTAAGGDGAAAAKQGAPESSGYGVARESASRVVGAVDDVDVPLAAKPNVNLNVLDVKGRVRSKGHGQAEGWAGIRRGAGLGGSAPGRREGDRMRLQDSLSDTPSRERVWFPKDKGTPLDMSGLVMSREEELAFLQANYPQLSLQFVMEYNRINREKWRLRGTALHAAAMTGLLPLAKVLTQQVGFSATIALPNGLTPVHLAAKHGHASVLEELLRLAGHAVDQQDASGSTALCFAVENNHAPAVRTLLHRGATLDLLCGPLEIAPLHMAIAKGHRDIARLLVQSGALTSIFDHRMLSPLHFAALKGDVETARFLTEEIESPVDINSHLHIKQWRCCGPTPLHVAFGAGNRDMALWLLAKGADVGITTSQGETPVHWALREGHVELLREPTVRALIHANPVIQSSLRSGSSASSGAPASVTGVFARPLVHAAVASSQREVVEFAVSELGLDLDVRNVHDANRHTLHVASQSSSEIFEYVLSMLTKKWEHHHFANAGATPAAPDGRGKDGAGTNGTDATRETTKDAAGVARGPRPVHGSDQTPSTRPVDDHTGSAPQSNAAAGRLASGSGNASGLNTGAGTGTGTGAAAKGSGGVAPPSGPGSVGQTAHAHGEDGSGSGSGDGGGPGASDAARGGMQGRHGSGSDGMKGNGSSGAQLETGSSHQDPTVQRNDIAAAIAESIVDDFNATLLHTAVQSLNPKAIDVVRFLVCNLGVSVTRQGSDGSTPLHLASMGSPMVFAEVAPFLVAHGANVNCRNDAGNTPLHVACMVNSVHSARVLIELGADIHSVNNAGKTPLVVASKWPAMLQQQETMRKALLQQVINNTGGGKASLRIGDGAGAIGGAGEGSGDGGRQAEEPPAKQARLEGGAHARSSAGARDAGQDGNSGDAKGGGLSGSGAGGTGGTGGTRGQQGSNQPESVDPSVPGAAPQSKNSSGLGNSGRGASGPSDGTRAAAPTGGSSAGLVDAHGAAGEGERGSGAGNGSSGDAESARVAHLQGDLLPPHAGSKRPGDGDAAPAAHASKRARPTRDPWDSGRAQGSGTLGPINQSPGGGPGMALAKDGEGLAKGQSHGNSGSGGGVSGSKDRANGGSEGKSAKGSAAGASGTSPAAPGGQGGAGEAGPGPADVALPGRRDLSRDGRQAVASDSDGPQEPPWGRPEVQLMMQVMVGVSLQSMQRDVKGSTQLTPSEGNPESVHDLLTSVMSAPEAMTQAGTQLSLIVRQARAEVDAAADDDVDMEGGEGAGSRLSSALARLPAPVIDRIVSLLPTAMLGFSLPSVRLSRQSVALRAERASDPAP